MLPQGLLGCTRGPQLVIALGGSGNFGRWNLAGKSSQRGHIIIYFETFMGLLHRCLSVLHL